MISQRDLYILIIIMCGEDRKNTKDYYYFLQEKPKKLMWPSKINYQLELLLLGNYFDQSTIN